MIIVGLTGGIGSGKTTVATYFKALGVPVYHADDEAKDLLNHNEQLQTEVVHLFGEKAYENGVLQRAYLAEIVFNNPDQLAKLSAIVHPAVADDFTRWCAQQNAPYVIQENALIFESNAMSRFDQIISVIVPKEIRIKRVMQRDQTTRKNVLKRMAQQCGDKERRAKSNFIIHNVLAEKAKGEVREIHRKLVDLAKQNS
ncbi:dephospho-CoA kinase [Flavobacteriaceae bacterium F08102]|nr:dephospho-CoA kinase [Flavobacteriaceae bacterium F08102]